MSLPEVTAVTDANTIVEFRMEAVPDGEASTRDGLPRHKMVEYLKISFPGNRTMERDRPVTEEDKVRFKDRYERFKAQQPQYHEGTLLSQWPSLNTAQVKDLNAVNVHTVEQLAAVTDSFVQNLGPGGRDLIAKAKVYLENAKGNAALEQLHAKAKQQEIEMDALRFELNEAKNALIAAADEKKSRRKNEAA